MFKFLKFIKPHDTIVRQRGGIQDFSDYDFNDSGFKTSRVFDIYIDDVDYRIKIVNNNHRSIVGLKFFDKKHLNITLENAD